MWKPSHPHDFPQPQTLHSIPNHPMNNIIINTNTDTDTDTDTTNDVHLYSFDSDSDSDSESESDYSNMNCFCEEDHLNFVTDFFESHEEYATDDSDSNSVSDPIFDNNIQFTVSESTPDDDFGQELGLGFDDQIPTNEEFEWEEVNEMVDDRQGLTSVIDRIEEISVSDDDGDEIGRNLEWEVLLAVNNFERNTEFDNDDYIYATEYDTVSAQFLGSDSGVSITQPAAKSFLQNLPLVVLTKEELENNNVVCAVCKDEILVEERVTRLPCCHHYHGDCIGPWLRIRNTCPVCRFELPTDDVDYGRGGLGLLDDVQVRYNFELLP